METHDVENLSADKRALLAQRLSRAAPTTPPLAAPKPAPPAATPPTAQPRPAPLSPAQEQLWYFTRLVPDNPVYNEVVSIRKDGPFEVRAFRSAFNEIVRRHQIWRSTFELIDGEPVHVLGPAPTLELPVIDISAVPGAQRERDAIRMAADEARMPYDLTHGPLLRPLLFRFADDDHRLYLGLHHLIFDGTSLARIVFPELISLYQSFRGGRPPSLPEPATQYADYATKARETTDADDEAERVDYWRRRLDGAPPLELALDWPRPARQRFRGAMTAASVSTGVADQLRALAAAERASLFQVISASFAVLLQRLSGQDDVVFGTLADMRDTSELGRMVGYCVTPFVLRADLRDDPSFVELLGRCREDVLAGLAHLMPFERLVRALNPPRQPAANPLFQVGCVLQPPTPAADPSWSLQLTEPELGDAVGNAKFDLLLELDERPSGGLAGRLTYDRDLFSGDTAVRIVACWTRLLQGIAADPRRRVSELPILTERQRRHQLVEWNATDAPYPRDTCLHELVTEQARRTPDAVAAVFDDERLTYRELDERADRVARLLAQRNPTHAPVAVYLERSLQMLVGMLAILKSGAAYLPLDPGLPDSRRSWMLEHSGAAALLTHSELAPSVAGNSGNVICIDHELAGAEHLTAPGPSVSAEDVAYLLYTSGSTGTPKGVGISHRSLVNLLSSWAREPGFAAGDRIVAITTYAFDIAAVELWLPLITGARVVIASRAQAADGRLLAALLDRERITLMQATPATWQMLIDAGWRGRPGLTAVSTGESLPPALAERVLERTGHLWNMYGPTETTIHSTAIRLEPGAPVTIGRPIANTRVYVLGRGRQPVPVGVAGELAIAGDGLAAGYLNQPELTGERFVADPFVPGERMYLTGDLARYLSDGRIQHLGRLDRQIKIRGFRVEPGEIEAALVQAPDVAAAVVVARGEGVADKRLIAYVVPGAASPDPRELRSRLRAALPGYMVPSAFVLLDRLPLSPNGKVDHAALPEPEVRRESTLGRRSVSPTVVQQRVTAVWERVLGVREIGLDDDFFELGGHSLLALRLLVEIERELGVTLPLSSLFESDRISVAGLAAKAERAPGAETEAGPQPPPATALFFVHPHESTMLTLRHFTAPLGSDYRLVGLLPERVAGRFDRSQSVESIADPMLDTIRRTQPTGPYYIAGYSLGGLIAYELAGRLRARGQAVSWLGVMDTATPAADRRWWAREFSVRRRLGRQWRRGPRGALAELDEAVRRELTARRVRLRPRRVEVSEEFDWFGAARLAMRYRCSPHDAPMDLFVTESRVAGARSESLGWDELHRGPLHVQQVGGDHDAMIAEGHVGALAELVSVGVRKARDGCAGS